MIQLISKPGLWMQLMTTKEPDDDMIEVGIASVEAVFDWREYLTQEFGVHFDQEGDPAIGQNIDQAVDPFPGNA